MIINDILQGMRVVPTSELQRLMCDVTGTDRTVDVNDIQFVIDKNFNS